MKRAVMLSALVLCLFGIVGAAIDAQRPFHAMVPGEAERVLGGQPANCYVMVGVQCPGQSGNCSNQLACRNNMCLGGPEIDPSQPSYQDTAPALTGWTQEMQAEGLYCQILYECDCEVNNQGVNACHLITPGTYYTYRQPNTVTGGPCPPPGI